MRIATLLLLLSLAMAPAARAAGDDPAASASPGPCTAPRYREFDFWLGNWDVRTEGGKLVGSNRIESLEGGCVMQEHWLGSGGVSGTSLTAYDNDRQSWHQTWVDSGGGVALLEGGREGIDMVLAGDAFDRAQAKTIRNRIRWTPLADGRVRQFWQQSSDGGATWTVAFDGYYARKP